MSFHDYVFLDGAHTFAIDALTFFLTDRLLKIGGHFDFDDYSWKLPAPREHALRKIAQHGACRESLD
jgi:hypothetical protein